MKILGNKLKSNFARNLQRLREGRGLSQQVLAEELNRQYKNHEINLKRTAIANYETGESMPRVDAMYCIADYFGRTIDELLNEADGRPVLRQAWLNSGQNSRLPETLSANNIAAESAVSGQIYDATDMENMCRIVAEKTAIHHFYLELTKRFLGQVREAAGSEAEQEKINRMFSKTYLGCLISKSTTMQQRAQEALTEQEYAVFMAFAEQGSNLELIAAGLKIEPEEVVRVFQEAQQKIAHAIGKDTKL